MRNDDAAYRNNSQVTEIAGDGDYPEVQSFTGTNKSA